MFKDIKPDRQKKGHIINYVVAGIAILLINIVAIPVARSDAASAGQSQPAEVKATAEAVASEVSKYIAPVIKQMESLDQEKLSALIAGGDKAAMDAEAGTLLENFPGGLKLRLFKPGDYKLDREAKPPLGFASISMLRGIEKSADKIAVQLHLVNSPDQHIVVIRKLVDADNKSTGLVHLSIDPKPLLELVKQQNVADAYIEFTQTIGDASVALTKQGVDSLKTGTPVSAKIKGAAWEINAWGGAGAVASASGGGAGMDLGGLVSKEIIIGVAAVIVLILGGLFFARRKKKEGEGEIADDVVYGGAVMAIMEGAHPGVEKLVPNLPDMGQSDAIQPLSQGLEGDDITAIPKPAAAPVQEKAPAKKEIKEKPVEVPPESTPAPAQKEAVAEEKEAPAEAPAEAATEEDMSLEFEMPGTETPAPAEEAPAEAPPEAATEEDMSLEFEMPGAETPAPTEAEETTEIGPEDTTIQAGDEATPDLSMEFEMPGTESATETEKQEPAKEEAPPDLSMEFELPGAETTDEADTEDEKKKK